MGARYSCLRGEGGGSCGAQVFMFEGRGGGGGGAQVFMFVVTIRSHDV